MNLSYNASISEQKPGFRDTPEVGHGIILSPIKTQSNTGSTT